MFKDLDNKIEINSLVKFEYDRLKYSTYPDLFIRLLNGFIRINNLEIEFDTKLQVYLIVMQNKTRILCNLTIDKVILRNLTFNKIYAKGFIYTFNGTSFIIRRIIEKEEKFTTPNGIIRPWKNMKINYMSQNHIIDYLQPKHCLNERRLEYEIIRIANDNLVISYKQLGNLMDKCLRRRFYVCKKCMTKKILKKLTKMGICLNFNKGIYKIKNI